MSDLLDLSLKAHGGLDRWREVKSLDARVSLTLVNGPTGVLIQIADVLLGEGVCG